MHLPQWVKIYLCIHSFCLNVGFNESWVGDCTAHLRSCPVLLGRWPYEIRTLHYQVTGHGLFIFLNQHYIKKQCYCTEIKKKREEMDFSSLFLCLDYDSLCGSVDALACFIHSCPWKEYDYSMFFSIFSQQLSMFCYCFTPLQFMIHKRSLSSDFCSKLCLHFKDMSCNTSLWISLCIFFPQLLRYN